MKTKGIIVALMALLLIVPAVMSYAQPKYAVTEKPKYDTRMAMFTWGCSDLDCKSPPGWEYKVKDRAAYQTRYHPSQVRGGNWGKYVYAPNTMVKNVPNLTPRQQWVLAFRERYFQ